MRVVVAAGVVVASVTAIGGLVASWRRRGPRLGSPPAAGIFGNGMAYVRWGSGPKKLLIIPGGPGNTLPSGMHLSAYMHVASLLVADGYTAWLAARKQHMPRGYGIVEMADDYAQLITDELDGHVDAAIGVSQGGLIALPLAARHPDRLSYLACVATGYAATAPANADDITYARLLVEGRTGEAVAVRIAQADARARRWGIARVLGALLAPLVMRGAHPYFAGDTLVEAEAGTTFDGRAMLSDIRIPMLLVGGGVDQFFTREVIEETARLIPDCTLRLYEDKDHIGTLTDERLPRDVLDFVERRAGVEPG